MEKSRPFFKFYLDVFNLSLNSSEMIIYLFIMNLAEKEGYAFPTNKYLIKEFNGTISESTLKRSIKKLKKMNLITTKETIKNNKGLYSKKRKIYCKTEVHN